MRRSSTSAPVAARRPTRGSDRSWCPTAPSSAAVPPSPRASATPTRLTLHGSELEIVRNGSRALFDLAAPHTPIEMHGQPGDRRWRVLVLRRSMSPYVIDATMVDPAQFTRVLRYYRPEV